MPKARHAAVKALEINGSLGEAYCSLGTIKWEYDWDWSGAETDFRRAIVLNPSYPTSYQSYGWCLAANGRLDEALVHMNKARELDPLSLEIKTDLAQVLWMRGQYDLAIAECESTLELDANFAKAYWALALTYQSKSMFIDARSLAEKAVALTGRSPLTLGFLGFIYGVSGKTDEAMKLVQELIELAGRRYVSPFWIGFIYMGAGEQDDAMAWLERAYQERSGSLSMLNIQPGLDRARSDPRFQHLLRRLGFPQYCK
jgi:tetratricopeptide (TPR) repeat protein